MSGLFVKNTHKSDGVAGNSDVGTPPECVFPIGFPLKLILGKSCPLVVF